MAIDNELEDEQKAIRIEEVHQLCKRFKWVRWRVVTTRGSDLCSRMTQQAAVIPAACQDSAIVQEIEKDIAYQKRSALYRFWNSMFACKCPTSWWRQFTTLLSRSAKVRLASASHP